MGMNQLVELWTLESENLDGVVFAEQVDASTRRYRARF